MAWCLFITTSHDIACRCDRSGNYKERLLKIIFSNQLVHPIQTPTIHSPLTTILDRLILVCNHHCFCRSIISKASLSGKLTVVRCLVDEGQRREPQSWQQPFLYALLNYFRYGCPLDGLMSILFYHWSWLTLHLE